MLNNIFTLFLVLSFSYPTLISSDADAAIAVDSGYGDPEYLASFDGEEFIFSHKMRGLLKKIKSLRLVVERFEQDAVTVRKNRSLSDRWFLLTHGEKKNRRKLLSLESQLNKIIIHTLLQEKIPHPVHLEAIKDYLWVLLKKNSQRILGVNLSQILAKNPETMDKKYDGAISLYQTRLMERAVQSKKRLRDHTHFNEYRRHCMRPSFKIHPQKTCPICMDEISAVDDGLRISCGHTFCKDCFQDYVNHSLISQDLPLTCPESDCHKRITFDELACCEIDDDQILFWKQQQLKSDLQQQGVLFHCASPDCPGIAINKTKKNFKFQCAYCSKENCTACNETIEDTCEKCTSQQERPDHKKRSLNLIASIAQACPHCRFRVTRVDGEGHCFKMTCPKCRKNWLWVPDKSVGKKWRGYGYHNKRGETFTPEEERLWRIRNQRGY